MKVATEHSSFLQYFWAFLDESPAIWSEKYLGEYVAQGVV